MHHDLTRNALAVLILAALIALSLWVLRPFLAATVWATMIVVATWPWLISLQRAMGGRRAPAVTIMSLAMLFLLVSPLWWAINTITERSDQLIAMGKDVAANGLPNPPEWVAGIPLVGEKISAFWTDFVSGGAAGLLAAAAIPVGPALRLGPRDAYGGGTLEVPLPRLGPLRFHPSRDGLHPCVLVHRFPDNHV